MHNYMTYLETILNILHILGLYLVLLLGVFLHFAKKKIKGQTMADIRTYFRTNLKDTWITLIAASILFVVMISSGEYSIFLAFSNGYMSDSLFNKAEVVAEEGL